MSDVKIAEIQSRIMSLRAELEELSGQLLPRRASADAEGSDSVTDVDRNEARSGESAPVDHERSMRTLRDLMWQGRWGLAYHLSRALSDQGVDLHDFRPDSLRAWALVARAERRSQQEALPLIQNLLTRRVSDEPVPLARQLFDWATLIGLLRSVDPRDVRGHAARFAPPEGLPETSGWWHAYVEALATAARPATRWVQLPEFKEVSSEIDSLMLRDNAESVRLAASCLMMSVRSAMRHVQVVAAADEQFVLNSELARGTAVRFDDTGAVAEGAEVLEQAICNLATSTANGRHVVVDEARGFGTEVVADAQADVPSQEFAAAAATPRAQSALSRLEAVEETLQSAVLGESSPVLSIDDPQRQARREAARARLERYTERLAARTHDPSLVALPFRSLATANPASMPVRLTADRVAPGPNSVEPERDAPAALASPNADERVPVESPSVNGPPKREIHASAVATAFGVEGGRNTPRLAPAVNRAQERDSLWGVLFNPQAAIIAGLLVIAGAVVAGLGTGLRARSAMEATANVNAGADDEAVEFTGDFPQVE